jgi:glycolate oxidase
MIDKLKDIFGEENVSDKDADLFCESSDASGEKGSASVIVWPEEDKQIHSLLQFVKRKNRPITIRGAGTGLSGGCVPEGTILVDMSRMNKIVEVNVQEKTAVVEPGVIVQNLNDALDSYDLFYPILPSSHEVCQMGGVIAANAAGLHAVYYGKARNWVSKVDFYDGTGKHHSFSRPEELDKIVGSEGILGIITKIHLHLTDVPGKRSLNVFKEKFVDDVVKKILELKKNPHVTAIEFIDKTSAALMGIEPLFHLIIEYVDDEGLITKQEEIEKIWQMRKSMGPKTNAKGYNIMEDPYIPEEGIARFIRFCVSNEIPTFGHVGVGIFHPRFKKMQHSLIKEMFALVNELRGDVSGEHGIGRTKKEFINQVKLKRFKDLKDQFDPDNILNRGVII